MNQCQNTCPFLCQMADGQPAQGMTLLKFKISELGVPWSFLEESIAKGLNQPIATSTKLFYSKIHKPLQPSNQFS